MNIKYTLGAMLTIPLLPVMFLQGKTIRSSVPRLPEAKGTQGSCIPENHDGRFLNIITLGESTIAGVGVNTHEEGFTGALSRALSRLFNTGIRWKVYAKSGYTARDIVEQIVPSLPEQSTDLIVIGIGGNDAFTLNSPRRWKRSIRQLISELRSRYPDVPIVFCNMPPIKEFPAFTPLIRYTIGNLVEILGKELSELVEEFEHVFYNEQIITLDHWIDRLGDSVSRKDFFSDGVHPSKLTYKTWAEEIAYTIYNKDSIRNNLKRKRAAHP